MFTELDIINSMAVATGLRPFAAEQTSHPVFIKAADRLRKVKKSVQARGLWFNTETREINVTADNELVVPAGCIKADPVDRHHNFTLRGKRMYNLDEGNFRVTEPIKLKMLFDVEIENMPVAAQDYVMSECVYKFYRDADGTGPKLQSYANEMRDMWVLLWREHLRNRQANIFDNPSNTVNRLRRGRTALAGERRIGVTRV